MSYLLSTQFLLDMLGSRQHATDWISKVPTRSVEISVISIGQVMQQIETRAPACDREAMLRDLRRIEASFDLPGHQGIIPFEAQAARVWSRLIDADLQRTNDAGRSITLSAASKMVVATALARSAALVEQPQPYHCLVDSLIVEHP